MSSTDQTDNRVPWIPILFLGGDAWLGLFGTTLFVGDHSRPKREVDPSEPTGLLPCLERPYGVVVAELHDREDDLSKPKGSLVAQVPLGAVPIAAVTSKSNYWAELALGWLAEMPRSEIDISTLENLERAGWASQRVRHLARRLRRERG